MTKKYKVTQEFMDALNKWGDAKGVNQNNGNVKSFLSFDEWEDFPVEVADWQVAGNPAEVNRRLIAIIQWFNHEDVFEVEKPHKFVVRSVKRDGCGDYWYVCVIGGLANVEYSPGHTTKFDTREEAESWANSHQEVVEIDEDGNEVTARKVKVED